MPHPAPSHVVGATLVVALSNGYRLKITLASRMSELVDRVITAIAAAGAGGVDDGGGCRRRRVPGTYSCTYSGRG